MDRVRQTDDLLWEAISGDVMPTEMIIEMVCRTMAPEVFTRDMPFSMPNEFCDRLAILTEGHVSVANTETALLIDDGPASREAHLRMSKNPDDPSMGRICGPGLLINPGVVFGFQRGILAVVPYDKQVEVGSVVHSFSTHRFHPFVYSLNSYGCN